MNNKKRDKDEIKPAYFCPKCANNKDFVAYGKCSARVRIRFVLMKGLSGKKETISDAIDYDIQGFPLKADKVICSNCGTEVYKGKNVPKLPCIRIPFSKEIEDIEYKINICSACGSDKTQVSAGDDERECCPECGNPWD